MAILINKIDLIPVFVKLMFGNGRGVGRRCPSQENVTKKSIKIIANPDTCRGGDG